jgi:hypothetical protein
MMAPGPGESPLLNVLAKYGITGSEVNVQHAL